MFMRLSLPILVFILFPFALISQVDQTDKVIHIHKLLVSADSSLSNAKFDMALDSIKLAEQIYETLETPSKRLFRKLKRSESLNYYEKGKDYFYSKSDLENSMINFEKSVETAELIHADSIVIGSLYQLSIVYGYQRSFEKAKVAGEKEYQLAVKVYGKDHRVSGFAIVNLGLAHNGLGNYGEAINCYLPGLDILQKHLGESHYFIGTIYSYIGSSYLVNQSYEKAIFYYKKYIDYLEKGYVKSKDDRNLAYAYGSIVMMLEKDKKYIEAIAYAEKALQLYEQLNELEPYFVGHTYMNLSSVYLAIDSLSLSKNMAKKALSNYDLSKVEDSFGKIRCYRNLAEAYRKEMAYEVSDSCFGKIFTLFNYEPKKGFLDNPNKALLLEVLSLKAKLYTEWGNHKNDISYLHSAETLYEESILLHDFLKSSRIDLASKVILSENNLEIFEGYITLNHQLFEQTKDPKYIHQIFDLCEKSKSALLHEALQHSNALNFAGIPDSLIVKEQELKLQINSLYKERESLLLTGSSETNTELLALSTKLLELRQAYQLLENKFETNYPEYFQLKFDLNTITVDEVQQKVLSKDQTLIEYFVGEKSIFILVINQDQAKVVEVKKDFPLEQWVKDFRNSNEADEFQMEIKTYCEVAHNLYNKLIAPIAADLKSQLIIIPDGVLGYLPFEALLVEPVAKAQRFKKHQYLIQDKQISYSYSTTLLKQMMERKHKFETSKQLLAFAPFFEAASTMLDSISRFIGENEIDDLKPLPNTGEEVYGIQKIIGGDVYYKKEATEENFLDQADNYRIIHLATHGKANDQAGNFSYLAFTVQKDSIENEIVYMRDLYTLQLNADMVVLSACETGIGELQKGEGIISLARGFTYAGAKSIITSLWSVEDKCTKDIMISFYKYLDQGLTKDAALRQAKLDYINDEQTTHVDAHPFYWSPFIGIGDMSKL